MIRKGQRAEVTFCKEGQTVSPIPVYTKEPISGAVKKPVSGVPLDGERTARGVTPAKTVEVRLSGRVKPAGIRSVQVDRVQTGMVQAVRMMDCQERKVQLQMAGFSHVNKDITLNTLFHE